MPKKRKEILDFLDSYAFRILRPLKDGQATYSEIMKGSGLVRSNFNSRLNELLTLNLIKVEYDKKERKPLYSLTQKGRKILGHMEEVERIYSEE